MAQIASAPTLCASRAFWLVAYPSQGHEMLFDAHTRSFAALGGVARRGIYVNMKTAVDKVLKGKGRVVNARFAAMASHDLFDPDFCNVASGWEKGVSCDRWYQQSGRRRKPRPTAVMAVMADYVDAVIMLSHERRRAPTARLGRRAPNLISTYGSYSLGGSNQPSESLASRPTEAQRLARLASAAALAASIDDSPEARKNQIQTRQALAQVNQAEQHLRDLRIEIQFQKGIDQPTAYAAYPQPLLTREGRIAAGKVLAGRAYLVRLGGNLDRPSIRPLLVGEHALTPSVENIKFLANQARFGLEEWSNLEEWACRKVNAEKNRK
jgi:hypothetical protein